MTAATATGAATTAATAPDTPTPPSRIDTTNGPDNGAGSASQPALRTVILCIEHPIYRHYLELEFKAKSYPYVSVERETLVSAIAENPGAILLLQSDGAELQLIEMGSKLKRLFGDEIGILLFSADYRTDDEAGAAIDSFLQYPIRFEHVQDAISALESRSRRILVIDDSKLVHNVLVPPLQEEGYVVHEAFDGEEGLTMARTLEPDLIICDIEMPKMNGFEVCAAIRASEAVADTYIIMSSTLGSAADQQKGFEAGVDEYITKPVIIPELIDRIKKIFKSARTGRESVLVVENDEAVVKNVAKSLLKQGFTTRTAASIRECMKVLRRVPHDLIIAQIDLTDGSIIDLFHALETLAEGQRPDVLIMTSRDSTADAKMVMNAGAAGVISKPFTNDSLLALVERTLADRRAAHEKAELQKYVSQASLRMALEKSVLSVDANSARAYRKNATIFFSDVAGFTSRCEKYAPKEIVTQINCMFDVMTRVIMRHKGDIDKFIGDACMAYWLDDDPMVSAERALRAMLDIKRELAEMNRNDPTLMVDPIGIRVGLNTGEVILCDIGAADARIDLTIIGDPVNVAARFESAGKQYGLDNLVSVATIGPLLNQFGARLIDKVKVKGKNEPLGCYEVFGLRDQLTEPQTHLIETFNKAMASYQVGAFEEALELFTATAALEEKQGDGVLNPSTLYQERCRQLLETPPENWDGVWTLTSK